LSVGGLSYDELRERERLILVSAMESVKIHRLGSDDFTWAEQISAAIAPRGDVKAGHDAQSDLKVSSVNLTTMVPNSTDFFAVDEQTVTEADPLSGSEA
jgi:hypothetical protein